MNNIILQCSKEDLNTLIRESIVEPVKTVDGNDKQFLMYTKSNLKGVSYPIRVVYNTTSISTLQTDLFNNTINTTTGNSKYTIEQWYKLFRVEFPTNASKHLNMSDGSNLRTGVKSKIIKNLQLLSKEGFLLEEVITAVKYEVWFRIKQSTAINNSLSYMKRMGTWSSDSNNISVMIERYKASFEFKQYNKMSTRKDGQGEIEDDTRRKITIV